MTFKEKLIVALKGCGVAFLIFILLGSFGLWLLTKDVELQEVDLDKMRNTKQTSLFYDDQGELVSGVYAGENRVDIKIEELPEHVIQAFIAIEDVRFFEHGGIDIKRIFGSLIADIQAGEYVQGASTITQQLIKLTHLESDKVMSRKIAEAYMAIKLEEMCSKEEILEMYLNYIYFGSGAYGIEAASRMYFNTHAKELTVDQAATLAAVINNPSRYSPYHQYESCMERRDLVLKQMLQFGLIDYEGYDEAINTKTVIAPRNAGAYPCAYFIDCAMKEAADVLRITTAELLTGGYRIYMTMERGLQEKAEQLLAEKKYFEGVENAEAALIITDTQSGAVKAVVGGRSYTQSGEYNRATEVRRQPGSVIKPLIVYGPAMEYGMISPGTPIEDRPVEIDGYAPKNFNGKYSGWTTVREAVSQSLNCPAVELLQQIGIGKAIGFAEKTGLTFDEGDRHLAIALGGMAYGCTPEEIAGSYGCIGNGGNYVEPFYLTKILNAEGEALYSSEPQYQTAMKAETAYLLTDMMRTVAKSGTAKGLAELEIDIAAKTGTVGAEKGNGNKDVWICAYTTEYTAAMWTGYDDQKVSLPSAFTGGRIPSDILKEIFSYLYSTKKPSSFAVPNGITEVKLDRQSFEKEHALMLASIYTPKEYTFTELFAKGSEPRQTTSFWDVPLTPTEFSVSVDEHGNPRLDFTVLQEHVIYQVVREAEGEKEEIKTLMGKSGERMSFVDETTTANTVYSYYIVPAHSLMKVDGAYLQGKPTSVKTVISGKGSVIPMRPSSSPLPETTRAPIFNGFFG